MNEILFEGVFYNIYQQVCFINKELLYSNKISLKSVFIYFLIVKYLRSKIFVFNGTIWTFEYLFKFVSYWSINYTVSMNFTGSNLKYRRLKLVLLKSDWHDTSTLEYLKKKFAILMKITLVAIVWTSIIIIYQYSSHVLNNFRRKKSRKFQKSATFFFLIARE